MKLIEVAVNVPIRRTFGRGAPPPLPEYDDPGEIGGESAEENNLQTFHYHLPPELEGAVAPGHLVWVPFGPQKLQGVVLRMADYSPVPTKAILRLARPEPVLTPVQIRLAEWIAKPTHKRQDYPEMPAQNYLPEDVRQAVASYILNELSH